MIYSSEDKLNFGKNKGFTLKEIWKFEPAYIVWLILHHDSFCIHEETFKDLPKPTPINIDPVSGSQEFKNRNMTAHKAYFSSFMNQHINVKWIIEQFDLGIIELKEQDFWFSNEVLRKNETKKRSIIEQERL